MAVSEDVGIKSLAYIQVKVKNSLHFFAYSCIDQDVCEFNTDNMSNGTVVMKRSDYIFFTTHLFSHASRFNRYWRNYAYSTKFPKTGFLRGRNCTTPLIQVYHKILKVLDNKHSVDVIYLDFGKAFDKFSD